MRQTTSSSVVEARYAIETRGLSFSYNTESPTINDLSLSVRQGEFVCILGHSGCGKSTLLGLLMGLLKPASGSISINGEKMLGPTTDRTIVFQDYSLFPWMTVRKNVIFGIKHSQSMRKKEAAELADKYLDQVGLFEEKDKYPHQLSGGMRQRTAIARSLAMDSPIWLFDEPFSALDPQMRKSLQKLVVDVAKKEALRTVLFVTHNVDEAVTLGERILFMSGGAIYEDIRVSLPYPREKEDMALTPEYFTITNRLAKLFYETRGRQGEQKI